MHCMDQKQIHNGYLPFRNHGNDCISFLGQHSLTEIKDTYMDREHIHTCTVESQANQSKAEQTATEKVLVLALLGSLDENPKVRSPIDFPNIFSKTQFQPT